MIHGDDPERDFDERIPMPDTASDLAIIGWREYVTLPDWNVGPIRAKADTGARSSAVDVSHLEELEGGIARFTLVPSRGDGERERVLEAPIVRRTRVRSSFGESHDRLFVETTLSLAGHTFLTEIGLVNRENMLTRMLLGRRSLENHFLVSSRRCYLHGRRKRSGRVGPAARDAAK